MTAKEFVKSKIPQARAQRRLTGFINGKREAYWLIRNDGENSKELINIASGKTESNAWVNAKRKIS